MSNSPEPSLRVAGISRDRIDTFLAAERPEHSRSRWQALIRDGRVLVNGAPCRPNTTVRDGDVIAWDVPEAEPTGLVAEDIPLNVLFEDPDVIVLNKPAGLVVHPAPGHDHGTLVHALLHHCPDLPGIGGEKRPGIVHRLDRDTSGVIAIAKTESAMRSLAEQFKAHTVEKEYLALTWGAPAPRAGTIHTRIARSLRDRKKMATYPLEGPSRGKSADDDGSDDDEPSATGREAVSHYATVEDLGPAALVRVRIETGRTHQIRVHLAHIRHAVLGDTVYGKPHRRELPVAVPRQMLHAARLAFDHPADGHRITIEAPLPADFETVLAALRSR